MKDTMYALVKKTAGPGLVLEKVPVPETHAGEIKIKILKTAICGTDVHIYNWDPWSQRTIQPPLVAGHEFVGKVVEVGEGISDFKVGDIIEISFGNRQVKVEVLDLQETTKKEEAKELFRYI